MISPDFMYNKHRHLLSREELEEENHVDTHKGLPTHSSILRCWILDGKIDGEEVDNNDTLPPIRIQRQKIVNTLHHFGGCVDSNGMPLRPSPIAKYKEQFENRPPALGATPQLLAELKAHDAKLPLGGVQQRMLFQSLRDQMLRQLISCDGAKCMADLVDILQKEMESGTPSPIPDWYTFSTAPAGGKIGYDRCSNWLGKCYRTEKHDKPQFSRCSACKMAVYCSRECQEFDWKARHKKVCKHVAKERKCMEDLSALFGDA